MMILRSLPATLVVIQAGLVPAARALEVSPAAWNAGDWIEVAIYDSPVAAPDSICLIAPNGGAYPAAWIESGLAPRDPTLRKLEDEELLAVGLFRIIETIRSGASAVSIKRCEACRRLFLDRSRGLRARHCSNSCRSRTFRMNA